MLTVLPSLRNAAMMLSGVIRPVFWFSLGTLAIDRVNEALSA